MRRLFIFLGFCVAIAFAACSKDGGGSGGSGGGPSACLVGQVVAADGTCLDSAGCSLAGGGGGPQGGATAYGWDPRIGACVPGTYVGSSNYQDVRFQGQMSVGSSSVLKTLLNDYSGLCGWTYFSWPGPDYSYLANRSYLDIRTDNVNSNTALIMIGLGASMPENGPAVVMYFTGTVYQVNGTSGIEIQANSTTGGCNAGTSGLSVVVNSQNFSSRYMDAIVSYRGQTLARTRLQSY